MCWVITQHFMLSIINDYRLLTQMWKYSAFAGQSNEVNYFWLFVITFVIYKKTVEYMQNNLYLTLQLLALDNDNTRY